MLPLLFALASTPAQAQIVPGPITMQDSIALWNGFNHFWDNTNHRVQRLGSFVENRTCGAATCDADLIGTAATGTGDDDANHTGRFTQIRSISAAFDNDVANFHLFGDEGSELTQTITVSRTVPSNLRGRERYVAVINGFDLKMADDNSLPIPDKLGHLRIDIDSATYSPTTGKVTFTVEVRLRMDCDSWECMEGVWDNKVEYDLDVQWALIGGDAGFRYAIETESDGLVDDYGWDEYNSEMVGCSFATPCPGNEIFLADHTFTQHLNGTPGFGKAAAAYQFLDLELDSSEPDDGMYLWSLALQLKNPTYNSASGVMDVSTDLFAKEWTAWDEMANFWSRGHAGEARIKADVVLLQFANATISTSSRTGFFPQDANHEEVFPIDF